jgi:hypothetical protein
MFGPGKSVFPSAPNLAVDGLPSHELMPAHRGNPNLPAAVEVAANSSALFSRTNSNNQSCPVTDRHVVRFSDQPVLAPRQVGSGGLCADARYGIDSADATSEHTAVCDAKARIPDIERLSSAERVRFNGLVAKGLIKGLPKTDRIDVRNLTASVMVRISLLGAVAPGALEAWSSFVIDLANELAMLRCVGLADLDRFIAVLFELLREVSPEDGDEIREMLCQRDNPDNGNSGARQSASSFAVSTFPPAMETPQLADLSSLVSAEYAARMDHRAGRQPTQPIVGSDLEAVSAETRELLDGAEISAEAHADFDHLVTCILSEHGLPKIGGDGSVQRLAARVSARICLLGAITPAGTSAAAVAGQSAVTTEPPSAAARPEYAAMEPLAEFTPSEAAAPEAWGTYQGSEYVAADVLPTIAASEQPAFVPSPQRSATYLGRVEQREAFITALLAELEELNRIDDDAVRAFVTVLLDLIKSLAEERRPDFERIWSIILLRAERSSNETVKDKKTESGES